MMFDVRFGEIRIMIPDDQFQQLSEKYQKWQGGMGRKQDITIKLKDGTYLLSTPFEAFCAGYILNQMECSPQINA